MIKVLLTATVQSHLAQFHKPLVEMLREQGEVEIHAAALDNLAEKNGLSLDFVDRVFDVPFSRSPFHPRNIKAYRQLKKIIREGGYDYIHCNTPVGGVVTRLAAAKERKKGTRVLYTAHGFHFYRGASRLNWLLYYPVERLLAHRCDTLITINKEDYDRAGTFACDTVYTHGVGVDPKRYHPIAPEQKKAQKEALGLDPNRRYILCVGELRPNKNQPMMIRAMQQVVQQVPDVTLLLAGNGPEQQNLESLITACHLTDAVQMLGYTTRLQEYQQISDLAVSCSYREGLPLNIVEAMLTGNPVVATTNRGHNSLITPGENGYLVKPGDVDSLAECVTRLLTDPDLAHRFGENGQAFARAYCFDAVKEELKTIYFG